MSEEQGNEGVRMVDGFDDRRETECLKNKEMRE